MLLLKSGRKSAFDEESCLVFGLKGIVYAGDFYYTSQICADGSVWFHDCMVTGKTCKYEGKLSTFSNSAVVAKYYHLLFILRNI